MGKKSLNLVGIVAMAFALSGCAQLLAFLQGPPPKTPLEIQAMQTREFDASKSVVFSSVLTALQNASYSLVTTDRESGLIIANGLSRSSSRSDTEWVAGEPISTSRPYSYRTVLNATVTSVGSKKTKLRINLVRKETGSGARGDDRIENEKEYQELFTAIGDSVFIAQGSQ